MSEKQSKTVFVLERLEWRRHEGGLTRLPGRTRLATFATFDEAEKARSEKENAIRQRVNPFTCGGPALHYQTSLDAGRLHDWTLDAGLTPPRATKAKPADWAAWWKKNAKSMDDVQREKMWQAFDRLRFYEVVERPERPVVYVVVDVNWSYNDEYWVAQAEGGIVQEAFRDRRRAEEECEGSNDIARSSWEEGLMDNGDSMRSFDQSYREQGLEAEPPRRKRRELTHVDDAVFYEVIEVELEE